MALSGPARKGAQAGSRHPGLFPLTAASAGAVKPALPARRFDRNPDFDAAAAGLLADAHRSCQLSGRAHGRILRVARTVADLAGSLAIGEKHMAAAIQFRRREA